MFDAGVNLSNARCSGRHFQEERVKEGVLGCVAISNSLDDTYKYMRTTEIPAVRGFDIWCTVGQHPHNARHLSRIELDWMAQLLTEPPREGGITPIFVGEAGLDYHRMLKPKEVQKACFRQQIELAKRLDAPMYLHCRDAWPDFSEMLRAHGPDDAQQPGIVHVFSETESAKAHLVAGNWVLGLTRRFPSHIALEDVEERVVLETDAPYFGSSVWDTAVAVARHVRVHVDDVIEWSDAKLAQFAR